jgi:hypothetical protein
LYRDRADCENAFEELKNQWGWGGFTTQDLTRCRLLAGTAALVHNWWSLFTRLADPEHHREAITVAPLLLSAIARKAQHGAQVTQSISSTHGMRDKAHRAYTRIAGFLTELRENAERLDSLWRIARLPYLGRYAHRFLMPPVASRRTACRPRSEPTLRPRRFVVKSTAKSGFDYGTALGWLSAAAAWCG